MTWFGQKCADSHIGRVFAVRNRWKKTVEFDWSAGRFNRCRVLASIKTDKFTSVEPGCPGLRDTPVADGTIVANWGHNRPLTEH